MSGPRRQRVVLRSKVRQERWSRAKSGLLTWLGGLVFLSVAVFSAIGLRRLLFHSDFFMVKSVEVQVQGRDAVPEIASAVSQVKGRSILGFSAGKLEKSLKGRHPNVRSLDVSRSFPDRVKVSYSMRRPFAFMKSGGGKNWLVDEEGVVFTGRLDPQETGRLPELVVPSSGSVGNAAAFLKLWSGSSAEEPESLSTGCLRKAALDSWGEISLTVQAEGSAPHGTLILWGGFDAAVFPEKFLRLQEVWRDLRKKSISAETIDLKEVPQKKQLALGDRDLVGRVIVKPAKEK